MKELCVTKLCDKVVCVKEGRAGRTADGRRTKQLVGGRECTTEKQEPHTKMWGKMLKIDENRHLNAFDGIWEQTPFSDTHTHQSVHE